MGTGKGGVLNSNRSSNNNSYYLLNIKGIPFNPQNILWGRFSYHHHFANGETEAQREDFSSSHNQKTESGLPGSKVHAATGVRDTQLKSLTRSPVTLT